MADGPTLRPKSTGQQQLLCPEMKWKMEPSSPIAFIQQRAAFEPVTTGLPVHLPNSCSTAALSPVLGYVFDSHCTLWKPVCLCVVAGVAGTEREQQSHSQVLWSGSAVESWRSH